jgi:hypothetical protein
VELSHAAAPAPTNRLRINFTAPSLAKSDWHACLDPAAKILLSGQVTSPDRLHHLTWLVNRKLTGQHGSGSNGHPTSKLADG